MGNKGCECKFAQFITCKHTFDACFCGPEGRAWTIYSQDSAGPDIWQTNTQIIMLTLPKNYVNVIMHIKVLQ